MAVTLISVYAICAVSMNARIGEALIDVILTVLS